MVTKMNLKLYKDNLLEQEHKDINCMYQNNNVSFLLNDCKMILNKHIFLRENNDFKFNINLCNSSILNNVISYIFFLFTSTDKTDESNLEPLHFGQVVSTIYC